MIVPRDAVMATASVEHGGRRAFASDAGDALIDFSVCLNAFGPAPSVIEAIRSAPIDEYPDPHAVRARTTIAARWNLPLASIALGAGSAELIQAVCFAYVRPGDFVVVVEPAFGEYRRAAELCGASVVSAVLADDLDALSLAASVIRQRRPRLVFVASPMNPSGVAIERDALRSFADLCTDVDALLILDQAYDVFSDAPLGTPALQGHQNVLHLRSLTKEHALAGIRVGIGVGPADVMVAVERARVPWATSTAAQAATIAAFDDLAQAHVQHTVGQLRAERKRLASTLCDGGIAVAPTATHYMLVGCHDATALCTELATTHRILVRDCTSFGLPRHVRIAARRPRENDRLIDALRQTRS